MALAAFAKDKGVRWVLLGWSVFTAENLVMPPEERRVLKERAPRSEYKVEIKHYWGGRGGQQAYQTMYSSPTVRFQASTCAGSLSGLASCSIFAAYWRFARHGARLTPHPAARAVGFLGRLLGLGALSQLLPPINVTALEIAMGLRPEYRDLPPQVRGDIACPFDFNAYASRGEVGPIGQRLNGSKVFGITRVSRRPELVGLGFFGLAGALVATTPTQVAWDAAWVELPHLGGHVGLGPCRVLHHPGPPQRACNIFTHALESKDRVQKRSGELSEEKEQPLRVFSTDLKPRVRQTSLFPFVALLDGRQSWARLRDEPLV